VAKKKVAELTFYELLDIPAHATAEEIQQAYLTSVSTYSDKSIASYRAISAQQREWIITRINQAYETLKRRGARAAYDASIGVTGARRAAGAAASDSGSPQGGHPRPAGFAPGRADGAEAAAQTTDRPVHLNMRRISGANLRNIREARGATLEHISSVTKVKKAYLEAIEREDVNSLPEPVFVRGFLKAYAKVLGLNPEEISKKYLSGD